MRRRWNQLAAALVAFLVAGTAAYWYARASRTDRQQVSSLDVPQTSTQWYDRGRTLLDARDFSGAVAAFQRAVELSPESAIAHYGLACALLDSGDPEGATAEIESALSLAPPDAPWRRDAESVLVAAHLRKPRWSPR